MLDSGEAAKNREIQPEATFDLISNPGSERGSSNPRMQIAKNIKSKQLGGRILFLMPSLMSGRGLSLPKWFVGTSQEKC